MLDAISEFSNILTTVWHRKAPITMHFLVLKVANIDSTVISQLQLTLSMFFAINKVTTVKAAIFSK